MKRTLDIRGRRRSAPEILFRAFVLAPAIMISVFLLGELLISVLGEGGESSFYRRIEKTPQGIASAAWELFLQLLLLNFLCMTPIVALIFALERRIDLTDEKIVARPALQAWIPWIRFPGTWGVSIEWGSLSRVEVRPAPDAGSELGRTKLALVSRDAEIHIPLYFPKILELVEALEARCPNLSVDPSARRVLEALREGSL